MCIRDSSRSHPGKRALSSVVERSLHTRKVTGSNPVVRTISLSKRDVHRLLRCPAAVDNDIGAGDEARVFGTEVDLSLIHISEPTRLLSISYAVFCLKK